ncbi:ABC transporter permease [Propionibacteriaceae bacterium Y2011]
MASYIVRRLLQMLPVLLGTTFLIYVMVFALPGEPWQGRCGERACSPAYIAAFKEEYNLDQPLLVQYGMYLLKLVQGDLGTNYYSKSVADELLLRWPTTALLAVMALIFEIVIGISAGILAGIRKGKLADNLVTISTLLLISIPSFVIGSLAQLVFGIRLPDLTQRLFGVSWGFPVTAANSPTLNLELAWSLVLPAMVLASLQVAYIARLTRTSLVENLRSDYVRTAKAKGLGPGRTVGVHTLRNSMVPVITQIGIDLGLLMGGAIVTERIFNINGIGFFLFRSINQQDGVSVVGAVVCLTLIFLLMNLIVDILYGFLDPRISHD